ncbi:ABC transporter ATP-binding protein [Flavobacteriaceae bacterium GF1]
MQHLISIKDLSVGYKSKAVVEHVNFQLEKGELCGIVGVNGIGKSTLLRTMAKLQSKIAGEICIGTKPLSSFSPLELAKQLSLVLTESIATKNLTVQELIALARQPYTNWLGTLTEGDMEKIEGSIQQFYLGGLKTKKCYELSDGQLQRVLIARAMAQDTPLLFLDEPTTHLDLSNKVQIFTLLRKVAHKHQKTVVFTTHEIDLAIQLCDKILILDGKTNPFAAPCELIEKGSFEHIFPSELVQFDAKTGSFKIKK